MANIAPSFQFYPRDFVADVQHMTAEQVGAYLLILCAAWNAERPGYLPNDPEILAPIGKLDSERWDKCSRGILRALKTTEDGKFVYSKRMVQVFEEQQQYRNNKKKASNARWHAEGMQKPSTSHADHHANACSASASASAKEISYARVIELWTKHTGQVVTGSLLEVITACEQAAKHHTPPLDPLEYLDRAISRFVSWAASCSPKYRPQLSPLKFVEHFSRIQALVSGADSRSQEGKAGSAGAELANRIKQREAEEERKRSGK